MYKEILLKIQEKDIIPKDYYLAHILFELPNNYNIFTAKFDLDKTAIHVGFYSKETQKVLSCKVQNENIEVSPEDDVFQKEKKDIDELNIEEVSLEIEDILQKTAKFVFDNYRNTISLKTMIIIQHLPQFETIVNITIIRMDFKTLNIKMNAKSGEVLYHNLDTLIDLSNLKKKE